LSSSASAIAASISFISLRAISSLPKCSAWDEVSAEKLSCVLVS
jgi:hypothetical protein